MDELEEKMEELKQMNKIKEERCITAEKFIGKTNLGYGNGGIRLQWRLKLHFSNFHVIFYFCVSGF